MKKKKSKLDTFAKLFSLPLLCAMTGFGTFWFYNLMGWNIWFSMIIGFYSTALIQLLFLPYYRKNGDDK